MPGATAAVAGPSELLIGHRPRAQAGAASSSSATTAEINERIRPSIRGRVCIANLISRRWVCVTT